MYCEEKKRKTMSKTYYTDSIECKYSKKEQSKVNSLCFHLRKLEKVKQPKCKARKIKIKTIRI